MRSTAPPVALAKISAPPAEAVKVRLAFPSSARLILIEAPAGYGKTTIMAAWARETDRTAVWLACSQDDRDPAVFLRKLIAAIAATEPGFGATILTLLDYGVRPEDYPLGRLVCNELILRRRAVSIFVDDADIAMTPAAERLLRELVEESQETVSLVLASRGRLPFGFAALRGLAPDAVHVLRPSDLALTLDDFAARMAALGHDAGSDVARAVWEAVEGWPGAIDLLPKDWRVLIKGGGVEIAVHRALRGYLEQRVLGGVAPDLLRLLVEVSPLDEVSPSLAVAATGDADAGARLARIEASGLFCWPVALGDQRVRFHPTMRWALAQRLTAEAPERRAMILGRAVAWADDLGDAPLAARYAARLGDSAVLLKILSRHADALWHDGHHDVFLTAMASLSLDDIVAEPQLACYRILLLSLHGGLPSAVALLDHLKRAVSEGKLDPGAAVAIRTGHSGALKESLDLCETVVNLAVAAPDKAEKHAVRWFESRAPSLAYWDPFLEVARAWAEVRLIKPIVAMDRLRAAMPQALAIYAPIGQAATAIIAARAASLAGETAEARRWLETAQTVARRDGRLDPVTQRNIVWAQAALAFEIGEDEETRRLLREADAEAAEDGLSGMPDAFIAAAVAAAQLAERQGEEIEADIWLGRAERAARRCGLEELILVVERANLDRAARAGAIDRMTALAARIGLTPGSGAPFEETAALDRAFVERRLLQAQLDAALLRYDDVVAQLTPLAVLLVNRRYDEAAARAMLSLAVAESQLGRGAKASAYAREAVRLVARMGRDRLILDQPASARQILASLMERLVLADKEAATQNAQLVKMLRDAEPHLSADANVARDDALSVREVEILSLMARGSSNADIAAELNISVGTIKWYNQRIFDKLEVRQRNKAVFKARSMGLVP